jgi:hypothetical protein
MARWAALAIAVAIFVVGLARGTWAVGGSDSSCYALMAEAFARAQLQPLNAHAREAPWPDAARTFAPGGFIPSPVRSDAASPICAPGFAVLLAPLRAIGGRDAIFVLSPLAGALVAWLTFVLGLRLAGPAGAVAAALIVAVTPIFVFQLVQPMNDMVVTALWTGIVALAATTVPLDSPNRTASTVGLSIGGLCGLAVLVRPNLAPCAAIVLTWVAWRAGTSERAFPWRVAAMFLVGASPFIAATGFLNQQLYGAPLRLGYGSASDLFAFRHIGPNLEIHGLALLQTQLAFPGVGVAGLLLLPRRHRPLVVLVLSVTAVMVATYLLYTPFSEWWYLRFLLPALPMMTVLSVATMVAVIRRRWIVSLAIAALLVFMASSPAMRQALDLARLERRFRVAGSVVRERLPANAIFITVWESGSVKYHGGAEAMLWDSLDPTWLDRTLEWWRARGFEPFIVLEQWEEPAFRQRFSTSSPIGHVDWPPRFEVEHQVRIFNPLDRVRYMAGERVPTEIVWADRP